MTRRDLVRVAVVTFATALIASSLVLIVFVLAAPSPAPTFPGVQVFEDGSVYVDPALQDARADMWVRHCDELGNGRCG